uniref:Uperin-3.6 n=1 Tax=Uperoleia mjobergii TaxID=104954 RepID=UPE36_UPEMJ|nr:RecName: Full=Uperin-3.6 [Uperoleia mjobergii]
GVIDAAKKVVNVLKNLF